MEKSENQSLVPRSPDGAVTTVNKGLRLITRMNEDLLPVIAQTKRETAPMMRRLGEYELHEEDYEQLHIWARDFTEDGYPITASELADELGAQTNLYKKNDQLNVPWLLNGRIKHANFAFIKNKYLMERIDLSKVPELELLFCCDGNLSQLILTKVPKLTWLDCSSNNITKLDFSKTQRLFYLECHHNQLIKLDLSKQTELSWLNCDSNQLIDISLAKPSKLYFLTCENNQLNNEFDEEVLAIIEDTKSALSPSMRLLGRDDLYEEDYQQLHIWARDFTEDGYPITALELANQFATKAVKLDSQWLKNGLIQEANFEFLKNTYSIKRIDLSRVQKLKKLTFENCQLTELNLGKVPELEEICCMYSQLRMLDLSDVPALTHLFCPNNYFSELDLSRVPGLTYLHCMSNRLTWLDLSHTIELEELNVGNNQFTQLDLSQVPKLTRLVCESNKLTQLNLSQVPAINFLWCKPPHARQEPLSGRLL